MTLHLKRPLFISFEGGEGCGKTTQIPLFCEWLKKQGMPVYATREPHVPEIRAVLWEGEADRWDALAEAFIVSADRHTHLRKVLIPQLEDGNSVVTDRFADSTHVYQGIVRGLPQKDVDTICNLAIQRWPDITLVLDIAVEVGLGRKDVQAQEGLKETRFENMGETFHHKVRAGYQKRVEDNPNRCVLIDASGTIEEVQAAIRDAFLAKVKELGLLA